MHLHPESCAITSSISVEHERRGAGARDACCNRTRVDERLCPLTHTAEIGVLDAALPRTFRVWSWGSSVAQDSFLHASCDRQNLRIQASLHRARKIDAVGRQRHAESIGSTRFDLKKNIGFFPGAGDFRGNVLRESRARHWMLPMLPDSSSEFW